MSTINQQIVEAEKKLLETAPEEIRKLYLLIDELSFKQYLSVNYQYKLKADGT